MSRVPRAPFIRCSGGCLLANPFGVTAESLQFVVVAFWLVRVKPIRLSDHAQRYASKRGFTLNEVEDVIRTAPWRPAELGRLECRKDFAYRKEWNGKVYATKQVRPVFVEEAMEIVVVTRVHLLFLISYENQLRPGSGRTQHHVSRDDGHDQTLGRRHRG